jgi:hypothetical protein
VPAQPGTVYELQVYAAGSGPLALSVGPAHGGPERGLHQVPASWVRFAPDRGTPGTFLLDLTVQAGAATGAYWSDVTVTAASSGSGDVHLGAAATTALVFTVGPSAVPPPPCNALDAAQSTGQFPAWPTPEFRTSSWKQMFASQEASERAAHTAPTAVPTTGTWPSPEPAGQHAPASPAANQALSGSPKVPSSWPGWLAIAAIILLALAARRKRSRS